MHFEQLLMHEKSSLFVSYRGSSHPGTEPRSPALHADSLPSEPPGKPSISFT